MTLAMAVVEDLLPLHQKALFFDVDGTLLELQDRPDAVRSDPALNELLEGLQARTSGAVALVSGRALEDLDRIFFPLVLTSVGLHGAVVRNATGTVSRLPVEGWRLDQLRRDLGSWVDRQAGLLLEDKGTAVAVHFRQAPELAGEVRLRMQAWQAEFGQGFALQPGKRVLEARPAGTGKGRGIRELMATFPFQGRTPVFFGDDETDEDAFGAVQDLGGCSIKIGPGPTCAVRVLADPLALRSLLRNVLFTAAPNAALP